jgi:hypothetical protein
MGYYVYDNWVAEGYKARIHAANCSFCNHGQGIHPGAGARNGRWLGPFRTMGEATNAAARTGGRVSRCAHCAPV